MLKAVRRSTLAWSHRRRVIQAKAAAGEEAGEGGGRSEHNERGRISFVVRWVSSRTIRKAWVRGEVLQKRIPQSDTDKFLPPPSDDAQLLIVGRDMSLFEKLDESTLRAKSFLLRTRSKQRISPVPCRSGVGQTAEESRAFSFTSRRVY